MVAKLCPFSRQYGSNGGAFLAPSSMLLIEVVVVVLTLTHRRNNLFRGHRTGSNNSGVEETKHQAEK